MEKAMSESTPIVTDAAGPPRTGSNPGQGDGATRSPCPICGFGVRQHDRFCRHCGLNLERWQSATTGSLSAIAAAAQEYIEPPVSEQNMSTDTSVSGKRSSTFPLVTGQNLTTSSNRFDLLVINGTARSTGPHTLEVERNQRVQMVEADYVLVACGTRAARPPRSRLATK